MDEIFALIETALPEINNGDEIKSNYTIEDIWVIMEYKDFYYIRFRNEFEYDNEMFRISKKTGKPEYFDWLIYAFVPEDDGKSIGEKAKEIYYNRK